MIRTPIDPDRLMADTLAYIENHPEEYNPGWWRVTTPEGNTVRDIAGTICHLAGLAWGRYSSAWVYLDGKHTPVPRAAAELIGLTDAHDVIELFHEPDGERALSVLRRMIHTRYSRKVLAA